MRWLLQGVEVGVTKVGREIWAVVGSSVVRLDLLLILLDDDLLLRNLSVEGVHIEQVASGAAEHGGVALTDLRAELFHLQVIGDWLLAEAVSRPTADAVGSSSIRRRSRRQVRWLLLR